MQRALALLVYLLPAAFAVWSIVRLVRNASPRLLYQGQRAFGWLALCTLPVAVLQMVRAVAGLDRHSMGVLTGLAALPATWYVLLGGRTVVSVFEANVKAWTGHRRDTMLDNAWVFLGLMSIQVLALVLVVGWRFSRGATLRDPVVLAVGAFMAVNAALAMAWPWFGT